MTHDAECGLAKDTKSGHRAGMAEQILRRKVSYSFPLDPTKEAVAIHGTPSDQRAIKNHLAEMKRQGLIWPWPPKRK
jgi:hypothetical protein